MHGKRLIHTKPEKNIKSGPGRSHLPGGGSPTSKITDNLYGSDLKKEHKTDFSHTCQVELFLLPCRLWGRMQWWWRGGTAGQRRSWGRWGGGSGGWGITAGVWLVWDGDMVLRRGRKESEYTKLKFGIVFSSYVKNILMFLYCWLSFESITRFLLWFFCRTLAYEL